MTKANYLLYLEQTINAYSLKTKQHLMKIFFEKKIAVKDDTITGQLDTDGIESVNVNRMGMNEALKLCLNKSDKAIKEVEIWEFVKDYRHSVIFTCKQFESIIKKLENLSVLEELEQEYLFSTVKLPIFYKDEERFYLKFNVSYSAVHPTTREEVLLKYPILAVFHKNNQLIEFRYDVLKKVFVLDKEQSSYINMIESVRKYIETEYECSLKGLDLNYMVNVAKNNKDIKLIAQYMKFNTGQNVQLEVGNNQEYMLPLIGELNTILLDYKEELEKVPVLKDALEQFMFEKEEMSDYPWIEVLWENEIKTRSIHVKFVMNYMNMEYGVIQHYYSNVLVGMERMNYVVEYIASNRNNHCTKIE